MVISTSALTNRRQWNANPVHQLRAQTTPAGLEASHEIGVGEELVF